MKTLQYQLEYKKLNIPVKTQKNSENPQLLLIDLREPRNARLTESVDSIPSKKLSQVCNKECEFLFTSEIEKYLGIISFKLAEKEVDPNQDALK